MKLPVTALLADLIPAIRFKSDVVQRSLRLFEGNSWKPVDELSD